MTPLPVEELLTFVEALVSMGAALEARDRIVEKKKREDTSQLLQVANNLCVAMSLSTSIRQIARLRTLLSEGKPTCADLRTELNELRKRIRDELGERNTFFLSSQDALALADEKPFGQEVYDKFPTAQIDIVQATRCKLLLCHTACVCHLMRVLEVGLHALHSKLNLPPPTGHQLNWGNMLNDIKQKIDQLNRVPSADWPTLKSHVEQAYAYLVSVKGVWRNPTMHIDRHYDATEADSIFSGVRAFMRISVTLA